MSTPTIHFGILGCADITRKVSRAISLSSNATISAIGSRSYDKAARLAKEIGISETAKVYGSYEAVLDDPEVDAVYLPLPTSLHVKWAVLAAQKKKHVLLEKPVALNVAELDAILDACESSEVQFMDGTMWLHNPRTEKMKAFLSDPSDFGELKTVHSSFTVATGEDFLENNIRVKPDLDSLGVLGDPGWYCIGAILWAAGYQLPKSVVSLRGTVFNSLGVMLSCGASMQWEDGKTATFHGSYLSNLTMDMTVVGENGTLRLQDFIVPREEGKGSFSTAGRPGPPWTGASLEPIVHTVTTDVPQEALLVREFSRLVGRIKFDGDKPERKWATISRKTQLVVDAVKASIERGYELVEVTE